LDDDRSELVDSDQKLLANILHAFEIYSALPQVQRIVEGLSTSSLTTHVKVTNALNTIILGYISMNSFVNSIPDFRILTVKEQCSFVERNLNGVAGLYIALIFREAGAISNCDCMKSFILIYGLEVMRQVVHISKQLDTDSTIVKLMLMALAFSSNCSLVDVQQNIHNDSLLYGTHRILGSQNVYVELLWKYMVYHYGYNVSVLRFARLIKLSLDLIKYSANTYMTNSIHHHLVDDFIQRSKQLLIINQNEQVPLWGKI